MKTVTLKVDVIKDAGLTLEDLDLFIQEAKEENVPADSPVHVMTKDSNWLAPFWVQVTKRVSV